jgi:hypothetical protein
VTPAKIAVSVEFSFEMDAYLAVSADFGGIGGLFPVAVAPTVGHNEGY